MAFGTMVFQNIESNSTDSADSLYHNMFFLIFKSTTASIFIFVRKLRKVHYSVIIFAFSITSMVVSSITSFADEFKIPNIPNAWIYVSLVGVFGMLGQCLLATALR